uniref:Uncharacterized protein n=1 Tax=Panagrolaimus sp. PS1159 TaxID=55785 RepID=A0AC35F0R1_9BILA
MCYDCDYDSHYHTSYDGYYYGGGALAFIFLLIIIIIICVAVSRSNHNANVVYYDQQVQQPVQTGVQPGVVYAQAPPQQPTYIVV